MTNLPANTTMIFDGLLKQGSKYAVLYTLKTYLRVRLVHNIALIQTQLQMQTPYDVYEVTQKCLFQYTSKNVMEFGH